jgi:hypothetical protein
MQSIQKFPEQLNHKQIELINQLAEEIQARFPEVKFVQASLSPEGANSLWLHFTKPHDEDRLIEVGEYGSERTMDILLDYGYHMVILPTEEDNGEPVVRA